MCVCVLNRSWRQHPTKQQLYGHLLSITKNIQIRRARHTVHCWRSRDELISALLPWTPKHGRAKAGRPAQTYIQQLCEDTRCTPEDVLKVMNDREGWWEKVKDMKVFQISCVVCFVYFVFYVPLQICPSYFKAMPFNLLLNPFGASVWRRFIHLFLCVFIIFKILSNVFFFRIFLWISINIVTIWAEMFHQN